MLETRGKCATAKCLAKFSAPYGAGRLMSRSAARASLKMDDYKAAMSGIYTTSVLPDTIDEAPMAYKPMVEIMELVQETMAVIDVLKPIYSFMAFD